MRRLIILCFLLAAVAAPSRADEDALWRALAGGGHVAIMRHATAPGTGDPDNFKLSDCSTQRNLSDQGRAEARAIGERFRQNGVTVAMVATSQWCRCRDTATEMGVGPVVEDPRLNSFFDQDRGEADRSAAATRAAIADAPRQGPITVFVTHQVNVTAATGVYPASGEIVVGRLSENGVEVVGKLKP